MSYGPIVPTLSVSSMSASLDFYTERLDFDVKWAWGGSFEVDASTATFACLECGEAVIFLSAEGGGKTSVLFVELPWVEDIDALAERLHQQGVSVDGPSDQPWGSREFYVDDDDGHCLRFSCPMNRTKGGESST